MDSVLKVQTNSSCHVATALQALHNHFTSEIWHPSIQCVSMKEVPSQPSASLNELRKQAHRQTEIFLDLLLLSRTTYDCGYILDARFSHILTKEETIFSQLLANLDQSIFELEKESAKPFPVVVETLKRYGSRSNSEGKFLDYLSTPNTSTKPVLSEAVSLEKSKTSQIHKETHRKCHPM